MGVTGKHIAYERKRIGWSQAKLAGKLGIQRTWLSSLENESRVHPKHLGKLNKLFGGDKWQFRSAEEVKFKAAEQPLTDHDAVVHLLARNIELEKRLGDVEKRLGVKAPKGRAGHIPMEEIQRMIREA